MSEHGPGSSRLSAADLGTAQKEAAEAVEALKKADPTLAPVFESSVGYAIFPKKDQGGFVVAGAHGTGLVFEQFTTLGEATLSQASGGGQTFPTKPLP